MFDSEVSLASRPVPGALEPNFVENTRTTQTQSKKNRYPSKKNLKKNERRISFIKLPLFLMNLLSFLSVSTTHSFRYQKHTFLVTES